MRNLAARGVGPAAGEPDPELVSADTRFRERLKAALEANLADPAFGIDRLARGLAVSRRQLQREVPRLMGRPVVKVIKEARMERGRALIRAGAVRTVGEAAAQVGLSPSYFSRLYTATYGQRASDDLRAHRVRS